MADETQEKQKKGEERHDVAYLRDHATALLDGANPHAVVGALSGESKKTFTVEEAKDAVRRYDKRKVPVDAGIPGADE